MEWLFFPCSATHGVKWNGQPWWKCPEKEGNVACHTSFHEIHQFPVVFIMKTGSFHTDYWKDLCLDVFPSTSGNFHTENHQFSLKFTNFSVFQHENGQFSVKVGGVYKNRRFYGFFHGRYKTEKVHQRHSVYPNGFI